MNVHTRGRTHWRFLLAAVLVIGFTATATSVAGLLQFKQFAAEISFNAPIKNAQVTIANPGNPQTLLLIGSDHRAGEPFTASNTDTMMLVRIDPNSTTINVLSVPRDLRVQIPSAGGYVTSKINATYSMGGPNLLIKVLRQQVFPKLHINHIIDVNFGGFQAMVDAIGCVYADVDRRYYNNTLYTNYSSIDIEPGYQKLCGASALAFVRFRHTDSDLVRNARQQDFLRWAKAQFSGTQLLAERDRLVKIFGKYAVTDHDLHTVDGLINLFQLVAFSAGHQIKQIPFPATLLPCGGGVSAGPGLPVTGVVPCYVTSDSSAEQQVYDQFMTPTKPAAPAPANAPRKPHKSAPLPPAAAINLTADPLDGKGQAAGVTASSLPTYYPRLIVATSHYCTSATCPIGPLADSYPRSYRLRDASRRGHPAYRMTIALDPQLGEYYGIEGTTWQHPPIINKPTQFKTVAGKRLMLFMNGHKLAMVAWRTPQGVYWVSNTLTSDLTNNQMLEIAGSLTRS